MNIQELKTEAENVKTKKIKYVEIELDFFGFPDGAPSVSEFKKYLKTTFRTPQLVRITKPTGLGDLAAVVRFKSIQEYLDFFKKYFPKKGGETFAMAMLKKKGLVKTA